MALYEHVLIARQDISAQQAEALNDQLKALIEEHGGHIAKIEYWGLRNLAYRIKKNRKGHYSLIAIDAPAPAAAEAPRPSTVLERSRPGPPSRKAGQIARACGECKAAGRLGAYCVVSTRKFFSCSRGRDQLGFSWMALWKSS